MESPAPSEETGALVETSQPRWPRVATFALGALTTAVALLLLMGVSKVAFTTTHAGTADSGLLPIRAVGLALIVPVLGLYFLRHRYPVQLLTIAVAELVVSSALGLPRLLFFLPFLPIGLNAMMLGHRRATWIALSAAFSGYLWMPAFFGDHAFPPLHDAAAMLAWMLVLGGAAEWMRVQRERRLETERVREAEVRRQANEERLSIARELHDVLGHDISLINVQASAALHIWEQHPEQARLALTAIKDASKDALAELRTALDVLRSAGESPVRAPSPSMDRLDELIAQAESAGLTVRTSVTGDLRRVPAGVDVAAYRIVQESLTNVMRHAGPASVLIQLSYAPGELTVQIDDDGRGPAGTESAGQGIAGMRDRALALGGTLDAKARPGGGFRVRGWLPWRAQP